MTEKYWENTGKLGVHKTTARKVASDEWPPRVASDTWPPRVASDAWPPTRGLREESEESEVRVQWAVRARGTRGMCSVLKNRCVRSTAVERSTPRIKRAFTGRRTTHLLSAGLWMVSSMIPCIADKTSSITSSLD